MANGHFIKVNGKLLPTPSSYRVTYQDFDSDVSNRSTDGTMVRDRITVKRKIEMEWRPISGDDMKALLSAVHTRDEEYRAIASETVTMPATREEFDAKTPAEQQALLDSINSYTGVKVNPDTYYALTEEDKANVDVRIQDGLADTNAERNERIFFEVDFFDPRHNEYVSVAEPELVPHLFYVGDRTADLLWAQLQNSNATGAKKDDHYIMWNSLTMNFIER